MVPELCIHLLGTPQVTLGGVPVKFRCRKAMALLAYLVVTRREHSREALAGLLYEAGGDGEARKNLRNDLGELTARLGNHLLTMRETVAFNFGGSHWIDSARFEAALAATGNEPAALQAAVDLHSGEFMAGVHVRDAAEFEEWVLHQREYWHGLLIDGWRRLVESFELRGGRAAAIAAAQRLDWTLVTDERMRRLYKTRTDMIWAHVRRTDLLHRRGRPELGRADVRTTANVAP
jgi:DNA-binding SARP family transcriptional activator